MKSIPDSSNSLQSLTWNFVLNLKLTTKNNLFFSAQGWANTLGIKNAKVYRIAGFQKVDEYEIVDGGVKKQTAEKPNSTTEGPAEWTQKPILYSSLWSRLINRSSKVLTKIQIQCFKKKLYPNKNKAHILDWTIITWLCATAMKSVGFFITV